MNRRGPQAVKYEQLVNQMRVNRFQKQFEKSNEKYLNSIYKNYKSEKTLSQSVVQSPAGSKLDCKIDFENKMVKALQ